MHLYTLTSQFLPKDIISDFVSAIWTERYFEAGEVQLVTPASPDLIRKLAHGTFLGLQGTKEVMLLDTQSIEDGLLTVTGQSLLKFLDERPAWFENPSSSDGSQAIAPLTGDTTAGELISSAVEQMVINPEGFVGAATYLNLNWFDEVIPGLQLGRVDANGSIKRLSINVGTLYNSIQSLAQEEGVGLKLYLESATTSGGPVFLFATYRGKNRTSEQDVHSVVRLTQKMDSLVDVKEVSSSVEYKNVLYVVYKGMTVHYAEPTLPVPHGFDRRVLVVQPDDIFLDEVRYEAYRQQISRDAFATHAYIHTVDGQASAQGIYQYTVDYGLGDIIELEGVGGSLAKARITEYIRTQDAEGEREYPTLSEVDHLSTGIIPDTEPEPIEPPGEGDPDFDDDVLEEPEWPEEPEVPDPNPDPDPLPRPVPLPPPPGPELVTVNFDGEPTPDGDHMVYQSGVCDPWPDDVEFYYACYIISHIKVTFTPPEDAWGFLRYGPIFEFTFTDGLQFVVDTDFRGWGINGVFVDTPHVPYAEMVSAPFVWYYKAIQAGTFFHPEPPRFETSSLQVAPFEIPKCPDTTWFTVNRWLTGTVVWYNGSGQYLDSNQWEATIEPNDLRLIFRRIPVGHEIPANPNDPII